MNRHSVALAPLVMTVWLAIGCATAPTGTPPSRAVAVGRVAVVDTTEGFILANFPTGPMMISMDKREIGHYANGDEILIDSFGRPVVR